MAPTYKQNPRAPFYDKALTDLSILYSNDVLGYVADVIAPWYETDRRAGTYYTYDMEGNFRLYDDKRVGVTRANRIDWSLNDATYDCIERALAADIDPADIDTQDDAYSLENDAMQFVTDSVMLQREYRVVSMITDTGSISNSDPTAWDDAVQAVKATCTVKKDITQTAMGAVFDAIHRPPTDIFIPFKVACAIANSADYLADRAYTNDLARVDAGNPLGPVLWGLKVHIVTSQYASTQRTGTSDPTLTGMWDDKVVVCYINPAVAGKKSLHLAKTFALRGWTPKIYRLDQSNVKPGAYSIEMAHMSDEKLIAPGCAYILTDRLT